MSVLCPVCPSRNSNIIKHGHYWRKSDSKSIQKYKCLECNKQFSLATFSDCYHQNKRRINSLLKKTLCSQMSMRRCAKLFKVSRVTISRKLKFLANQARDNQKLWLEKKEHSFTSIQFDDLETFEHTNCKPVTVCMAVEFKTRKIIDFCIAPIAPKGLLAKVSRKKYGRRKDCSKKERDKLFFRLSHLVSKNAHINSDKHPHYEGLIKKYFSSAEYVSFKGVKSCLNGQGELKKTFFDPLFSINHTFAMLRANINRLIRKTWCTTKNISALNDHIALYVDFHNQVLT